MLHPKRNLWRKILLVSTSTDHGWKSDASWENFLPAIWEVQGFITLQIDQHWLQMGITPVHFIVPWHGVEDFGSRWQRLRQIWHPHSSGFELRHQLNGLPPKADRINPWQQDWGNGERVRVKWQHVGEHWGWTCLGFDYIYYIDMVPIAPTTIWDETV